MKRLLACLLLLVMLGMAAVGNAESYTDEEIAQIALNAQRALDIQAVENLMSRHVLYHCYGEHEAEMKEIWVQEPENQATASFGQNQGYYVGYDAIWEAYVEGHNSSWLETAKSYAARQGIDLTGLTDEEILETYGGMGQLLLHVTTTAIIEVAEDGQTAKGYWYSPGMIAESGQTANSIWEAYGADFIKENGVWKMWHLHMYTDFMCAFGDNFTGASGSAPGSGNMPQGTPPNGTPGDGRGEPPQGMPPESAGEAPPAAEKAETDDSQQISSAAEKTVPDDGQQSGDAEQGTETKENAGGQINYEGEQGAKELAYESDNYIFSEQYTQFSATRLRSQMEVVPIPLPYSTWSFDDDNFCPTVEEYASVGVDVSEWYDKAGAAGTHDQEISENTFSTSSEVLF